MRLVSPRHILLRHTGTPDGQPVSLADLDRAHAGRGWVRERALVGAAQPRLRHLGYHYVIQPSGVVDAGCSEREVGLGSAHAIQVALVGTGRYTAAQWASLRELLLGSRGHPDKPASTGLLGRLGLGLTAVQGRPGFEVAVWLAGGLAPLPAHLLREAA